LYKVQVKLEARLITGSKAMSAASQHTATDANATEIPAAAGTMRAVVQDTYGTADVLRLAHVALPEITDDKVLVRVRAAGVHIGDWHLMTGQPYLMRVMGFGLRAPKVPVRGTDVAGTVEVVGKNVTQFRVGGDVFGTCAGSFAEYATGRVDTLTLKPVNLTFQQAAAIPTSACTALQALKAGQIAAGQEVLIIGASGGVGLFAVQIAKSFGAQVTGVCSPAKVDLVRSVGADHVFDYTRDDFTRSGQRYDLILDMGGNRSLSQLRRALTPAGTLVLVGGEGGGRLIGGAMGRSMRALVLSPFVSQRLRMVFGQVKSEDLQFLTELIEAGKVAPVIDKAYPLSGVTDAIRDLHSGRARGKFVITM
jgi:NADPH:quinone reductase-like Zn-dependent oxidoreductase